MIQKQFLSGNGLTLPLQMSVLPVLVRSVLMQTCCAQWFCERGRESSVSDDDFKDIALL